MCMYRLLVCMYRHNWPLTSRLASGVITLNAASDVSRITNCSFTQCWSFFYMHHSTYTSNTSCGALAGMRNSSSLIFINFSKIIR